MAGNPGDGRSCPGWRRVRLLRAGGRGTPLRDPRSQTGARLTARGLGESWAGLATDDVVNTARHLGLDEGWHDRGPVALAWLLVHCRQEGADHSRSKAALTRRSVSGSGGTQAAAHILVGAGLDGSAGTGMLTSASTGSAAVSCLPASSRAARGCHAGLAIAGCTPLRRRGPVARYRIRPAPDSLDLRAPARPRVPERVAGELAHLI
jgi:hypothetical protein